MDLSLCVIFLLKQVRTQQLHEMKKREKDYIKLQASVSFSFLNDVLRDIVKQC
jgi:ribosome biogenesis protein Nip4